MPSPASLRDDFRRMIKPSGEGQPRIRPSTAKEKTLDIFNQWELPLVGGLGDFIKEQAAGEMMAPGIGMAYGVLPKKHMRRLALEVAEQAEKIYKKTPKIQQVATDMALKHPAMSSHMAGYGEALPGLGFSGRYIHGDMGEADRIIRMRPTSAMPAKFYKHILDTKGEAGLVDLARKQLGTVQVSPELENEALAEIYKTIRHEFGHLSDDMLMKGRVIGAPKHFNSSDPRYWISQPEVRARAIERNYGRDMGIKDANKIGNTGRRMPYGMNVMNEMNTGMETALEKMLDRRTNLWPMPVDREQIEHVAMETLNRNFGKRGGLSDKPARIDPSSYNDTMIDDFINEHGLNWQKFRR